MHGPTVQTNRKQKAKNINQKQKTENINQKYGRYVLHGPTVQKTENKKQKHKPKLTQQFKDNVQHVSVVVLMASQRIRQAKNYDDLAS